MTINSIIVSPIKLAVFALFGLMAGACTQAPVKATTTIPKVDISALPFAMQPLVPVTVDSADAADLESTEQSPPTQSPPTQSPPTQSPPTAAAPIASEDVPTESSTPDTADDRSLPPSLTSLPKIAITEQTRAQPENIVEIAAETAAETAAAIPAVAAAEQAQPTATPDTATESTQAPETLTAIDDIATGSSAEKTSTAAVEALPSEPIRSPPASGQNVSGRNTTSVADSTYDGCKIIRIYGNYISVSITRNRAEALLVSLDLPKEYNNLQTMVNYIAYADFEPASYYPYEDETPTKIAELIRNGNVQCVLQES